MPMPASIRKRAPWGLFKLVVTVLLFTSGCLYGSPSSVATSDLKLVSLPHSFEQPLLVTYAESHPEALFVVEKTGRIKVVLDAEAPPQVLLDIRDQVSRGSEQGLLGLAFHPRFGENGLFFVNYTDRSGDTQVVRYQVRPGTLAADPDSRMVVLTIPQPRANHNGGMLAFGPDGFLYIGTGDGGGAGDPEGNGQKGSTLLGKLLRIDVDGGEPYTIPPTNPFVDRSDFLPEIWAFGLRNPWRFSFDRLTGDLYIADVGQNAWEELNYQPASDPGGQNYGWNRMEGRQCYPQNRACSTDGTRLPVLVYSHQATGGCSITGGYVYRGTDIPWLYGKYVFGDYCSGEIWSAEPGGTGEPWPMVSLLDSSALISSFGEDAHGELYITDLNGGKVYRLVDGRR